MKRRKIDTYIEKCKSCVDRVTEAVESETYLNKEELFDYYFKLNITEVKDAQISDKDVFKEAKFLAGALGEMDYLRVNGYSNRDLISLFKYIRRSGRMFIGLGTKAKLECYDADGVLYIDAQIGEDKYSYGIKNRLEMTFAVLSYATWVVVYNKVEDDDYTEYLIGYLSNVYKEIASGIDPKPYISNKAVKTLKRSLMKSTVVKSSSEEGSNVIDFSLIVGGRMQNAR